MRLGCLIPYSPDELSWGALPIPGVQTQCGPTEVLAAIPEQFDPLSKRIQGGLAPGHKGWGARCLLHVLVTFTGPHFQRDGQRQCPSEVVSTLDTSSPGGWVRGCKDQLPFAKIHTGSALLNHPGPSPLQIVAFP